MEINRQIARAKEAILKGVDAGMFIAQTKPWAERRGTLLAEADRATQAGACQPAGPNLGSTYRQMVGRLNDAFEDEALRAKVLERIRAYRHSGIEAGR